jgi:hypothetical protein
MSCQLVINFSPTTKQSLLLFKTMNSFSISGNLVDVPQTTAEIVVTNGKIVSIDSRPA